MHALRDTLLSAKRSNSEAYRLSAKLRRFPQGQCPIYTGEIILFLSDVERNGWAISPIRMADRHPNWAD